MDANELNQALKGRMEEVVTHLYPSAKKKGNVMTLGDIQGNAGDSLQIYVNGPHVGMWVDRASSGDKGGTPLWLWKTARGISYVDAIKEAKEWAGIKDDSYSVKRQTPKTYAKLEKKGLGIKPIENEAIAYLHETRGIELSVLDAYKVSSKDAGKTIVFPYIDENGEACHLKFLGVERPEGKKKMWATKDTKRCLFGMHAIPADMPYLVISEGETCSLSWATAGIPACSVPNGVSDMEWIEICWDWMERFERIYIAMDMDEVGREACHKIAKRIGLHRAYIVTMPHKDANDCLLAGKGKADFELMLKEAKQLEMDEVRSADAYGDAVWDFYDTTKGEEGITLPWPELGLRLRPGELTIFSGFSGHGKTLALNQLMIHSMSQGWSVMNASLEVTPARTLQIMARITLAKKMPDTKEELIAAINYLGQNLWFYDLVGVANHERMLEVMTYARKRHGIDLFVIDSLFKLDIPSDGYNEQKQFMAKLTAFVNTTGAHVILVAHSRKMENEDKVPTKADIAGSQDINNAAWNCVIVWRNKLKTRLLGKAKEGKDIAKIMELEKLVDGRLSLDKQKYGTGEDNSIGVFFDSVSWQFSTQQHFRKPYFIYEKPKEA